MLSFDEALARVLEGVTPLGVERVALDDCVGRVLVGDLVSGVDLPPFDYSAMDGYAVRSGEIADGAMLPVVGESRAGSAPSGELRAGTVMRIFTGAPMPLGADAVVMQENIRRAGDGASFVGGCAGGANVRLRGGDLARGAVALRGGTRLTEFHVPLLASLEMSRVTVGRRPAVTVLSTGDELRDAGSPDRPGSIVDSNGPALSALVRRVGGVPRRLPSVRDTMSATRAAVREAIAGADVVLSIGGVSVGDHDLVKAALESEGVTLDFWKVAIKPGKPLCVGVSTSGVRVLGLPGNPSSALLTFVLFGAPLLRALQGDASPRLQWTAGRSASALRHVPGRTEFVRASRVHRGDGAVWLQAVANQSSGAVTSFAWSDALLMIPAESEGIAEGDAVRYARLEDV